MPRILRRSNPLFSSLWTNHKAKQARPAGERSRSRKPRLETLEQRNLLAADLVISEFLARNEGGLLDSDGDASDWIEIHNPTDGAVDLAGWALTDDADELDKWQFTSGTIAAGEFLVVSASAKDIHSRGAGDHTNFSLSGDGEYLALVTPEGVVGYEFAPTYPRQDIDISYGIPFDSPDGVEFVRTGTSVDIHIPTNGDLGQSWIDLDFDPQPGAWFSEETGVGFGIDIPDLSVAGFTVHQAHSTGKLGDLVDGDALLAGENVLSETTVRGVESINYLTSGDSGNFGDDLPYPDGGGNNFSLRATATLLVTSAGQYTFGSRFDQGGRLSIDGEILFEDDSKSTGHDVLSSAVTLTEGIHAIEYIMLQRSRSSAAELYAAAGSHQAFSDAFKLLGSSALGGLQVFSTSDGSSVTSIEAEMRGTGASAYMRVPFTVDDAAAMESLTLKMQYNDGFVAYLNGTEVARSGAPANPSWNSLASTSKTVDESIAVERFDITEHLGLLQDGANLLAIHAMNSGVDDDTFLVSPQLSGGGLRAADPVFFGTPTPGEINSSDFLGFVGDTRFSVDRGLYDEPFALEITSKTEGATIRYTTDGTEPGPRNGLVYAGPIQIAKTTTLRAAAFKPGFRATNIDTQTYVFVEDIIQQDHNATLAAGLPATWGGVSPDYGMDPDVIGENGTDKFGGVYTAEIRDSLKSIPTMSLVLDVDDMFGSQGIYSRPTFRGAAWERSVSMEIFNADGSDAFQLDAGIRIQGGASRSLSKKHSFKLLFKNQYGPGKLDFPIFGEEAVDKFDQIILRMHFNDAWQWSGAQAQPQFVRDKFGRQTMRDMGQEAPHGTLVHLYINGVYWGMYNPVERPDASYGASYWGGEKEEWDARNRDGIVDGNSTAWNKLLSMGSQIQSAASETERTRIYNELQGLDADGVRDPQTEVLLDSENLIDYMMFNLWGGNGDWPTNNWYAARRRGLESTGFKFISWDSEFLFDLGGRTNLNTNQTGISGGVADPYARIKSSLEFRMDFADRVQKHFFNGGALYVDLDNPEWDPENPERNVPAARFVAELAKVHDPLVAESARWGDQHVSTPRTRDAEWASSTNNLLTNYFPFRNAIVLDQFREAGLYPAIDAAIFEVDGTPQHGGAVQGEQTLTLDVPRGRGIETYYTLDGSDPRLMGGDISPTAIEYVGDPIVLTEATNLRVRVRQTRSWSALNEAQFVINEPASDSNLTVSEINYNPSDPTTTELAAGFGDADQFEFIELLNKGNGPISLAGVTFTDGVEFNFDDAAVNTLDVGGRLVLVSDSVAFAARYGDGVTVAGEYVGGLSNGGEALAATGLDGETIFDFEYDDNNGWPGRADGNGSSLELIAADGELADDGVWRSSAEFNGSPGSAGSGPVRDVVINEVLSNSPGITVDEIELHNTTGTDIDVSGWLLSDSSSDYGKFAISAGTVIAAGGYLVLDENDFNPTAGEATTDFAFNGAHGDDAWLIETADDGRLLRFADHVDFGAMADGETFGRSPNGTGRLVPNVSATLGAANSAARIGPLVISEVMYNPDDIDTGDLEYVEIYNPTGATIDMTDWRLDGGVELTFDPGTTLAAGKALVAIRFNPENAENAPRLADFKAEYNLDESVQIVGGYKGRLDNGGERLELLRPGTPPLDEPDFVPGLLEDEVRYDDESPWPAADGTGESLTRTTINELGDLHTSWEAAAPTPGSVSFAPPPATPTVVGVSVSGSEWSDEFIAAVGGQIDVVDSNTPLSWSGIDQIHVQLDGDPSAPLTKDDLIIGGGPDRVSSVSYDAANFVVTWNLAATLDVERLDLSITSDLVSAEGGGSFTRIMNILPGDVNGSFAADLRDVQDMRAAFLSVVGDAEYNANIDIDGSGEIDIRDLQQLRGNLLESLPQAANANEADWNVAVDAALEDLFGE